MMRLGGAASATSRPSMSRAVNAAADPEATRHETTRAIAVTVTTMTRFVIAAARPDPARQAADLESADLRQHVEAVARVGPVDLECSAYGRHLARQGRLVDAGPAPGHLLSRGTGDRRGDRARRRRVADAHLAG